MKFFPRGEITNYRYPKRVWMKRKNQRVKMSSFKNIFMASAYYLMITIFFGKMTGKLVMNVLNFNKFKVCKYVHFQRLLKRAFIRTECFKTRHDK